MIRPTSWGLGSAALAVFLAAAPAVQAAEIDKLLPADSEGVVYVNVRQLIESELVKKYALEQLKQAMAGNDAQKALKDLGLDPLTDISRIVVGMYGTDPQNPKVLGIVHGKFDADKLYKAAEVASKKDGEKLTLIKEAGSTLIKIQLENNPNPIYATLVDQGHLVFGTVKELVTDAVAVAGGAKKAAIKPALSALITQMDEKSSLFVVGVISGKAGNVPIPGLNDPAVQKNLEKMDTVTVTLRVTGDVSLDAAIGMKNAEAADEFGKMVDQGLAQVKGILPLLAGDPKMKPLVELAKTLTSGVKESNVVINAKLSGTSIAKMLNPND